MRGTLRSPASIHTRKEAAPVRNVRPRVHRPREGAEPGSAERVRSIRRRSTGGGLPEHGRHLDMMIFQGQVMASYRPDNRKLYPLRRFATSRRSASEQNGCRTRSPSPTSSSLVTWSTGPIRQSSRPVTRRSSARLRALRLRLGPTASHFRLSSTHLVGTARRAGSARRQAVADGLDLFRRSSGRSDPRPIR